MSEGLKLNFSRPNPIVPAQSVAGRTLMLLIGIMTFLSCVTFGGVLLVQKSAMGWSAEVGRELTIQIRPLDGEVIESNLRLAVSLSEAVPGVASARVVSIEESEELLAPWLGQGLDLSDLAIPRLVIVQLADPNAADIARLESEISAIPGATLETHAAWRVQLNTMAGTIVVSGILVLALILVATALAIVFATRGTMSTNREIVDVLHFIGASNTFIAGEFQGRFLLLGLKGGLVGGLAAIVFFIIAGTAMSTVVPEQSSAQLGVLFGQFALGISGILGIVGVVLVIAGLTAITSRLTVRRFLSQIS
ncbi:cell division protein FtsX [Pelagibacterium halotolerans]|uniref:cell division protein FtsX n=1 Tax=Pelagibacterium halotolerans TaxID=531813 RepID=UPI00089510FB|nr:ABC transporter permease [Pelagibacterium halotolerans]QJR17366.1 ABC transporter permease [Pelagibacterium halotolerans]SEA97516.1 cell division transport system permease protein [Pelagibacterium halotolerans]